MADTKISELTSATLPLAGSELLPIVQGGATRKVAASAFDPWTYIKLATTVTNSTTTAAGTALAFAPAANLHYVFEGMFFVQSALTSTGVRIGLSWPTGTTQEAAWLLSPSSATAFASRFWGAPTAAFAGATGVAGPDEGLHGRLEGQLITGASPSGSLTLTLASEVSGSEVRVMANSWIRYRVI